VIRTAGGFYGRLVSTILDESPDPVAAVLAVFDGAARTLLDTDFADACPIATVAIEVASTHDGLRRATADVFTEWITAGTNRFQAWGADPDVARRLAITMVSNLDRLRSRPVPAQHRAPGRRRGEHCRAGRRDHPRALVGRERCHDRTDVIRASTGQPGLSAMSAGGDAVTVGAAACRTQLRPDRLAA